MSKTFNRGKLKKLVEQGKVEMVEAYHFDDMTGSERTHKVMPVAMRPADWHDRQEGVCYLFEHDFTSKSGRAWQDDSGLIVLYVHSNCDYTLRIRPELPEPRPDSDF
jgi:hypothetical protein